MTHEESIGAWLVTRLGGDGVDAAIEYVEMLSKLSMPADKRAKLTAKLTSVRGLLPVTLGLSHKRTERLVRSDLLVAVLDAKLTQPHALFVFVVDGLVLCLLVLVTTPLCARVLACTPRLAPRSPRSLYMLLVEGAASRRACSALPISRRCQLAIRALLRRAAQCGRRGPHCRDVSLGRVRLFTCGREDANRSCWTCYDRDAKLLLCSRTGEVLQAYSMHKLGEAHMGIDSLSVAAWLSDGWNVLDVALILALASACYLATQPARNHSSGSMLRHTAAVASGTLYLKVLSYIKVPLA
jgi:hypothetical protein